MGGRDVNYGGKVFPDREWKVTRDKRDKIGNKVGQSVGEEITNFYS